MHIDSLNSAAIPDIPFEVRLMNATASVLFMVGSILLVALALTWFVRQPLFSIHSIRVDGDTARNSVSTIRANVAPHLRGNLFTINLADARRVFENIPWVRHAVLRRVWPNRLEVNLEEHRPAAFWGDDRLVNVQGEVFDANLGDVDDGSLPTLDGPDGSAARVLAMYQRLAPMFAGLESNLDSLELSGRGSWRAELASGAEIELGRGDDDEVIARTQRFLSTVTEIIDRYKRPLEYADLRHTSGYAVRLRGITTTPPAPGGKTAKK